MLLWGYMNARRNTRPGFTIVELLIVIVVIAILAAVTIVAYNGISNRATDSRRASDIAAIKRMLLIYHNDHGGLPMTGAGKYTGTNIYAGWDSSHSPTWLAFLKPTNPVIPVDPVNTLTTADTNPRTNGNYTYFYYCYVAPSGPLPATDNVRLGYHKTDGTPVYVDFPVDDCL